MKGMARTLTWYVGHQKSLLLLGTLLLLLDKLQRM